MSIHSTTLPQGKVHIYPCYLRGVRTYGLQTHPLMLPLRPINILAGLFLPERAKHCCKTCAGPVF